MCFIIVCWFCVLIDVILTSWIIISKMRRDKEIVEATFLNNVLFCFNFRFIFIERVKIFMFLLNKRLIVYTFSFCFSARIILFINFLMNNVLIFIFSSSFRVLYISVLFFLSQAAIQKQDFGITWRVYSHVMWLRWLCTERDNFDPSISTYIESRSF
jgi:hypothetical protein